MNPFFITTAIDYVNSTPHIGTAYEKIGADVLARFHRLMGDRVCFQMGNDEHSVNVKKSAAKEGLDPKAYCDAMRPKFEEAWKSLDISYDQFIQTSDPNHHQAVKKFFQMIYDKGDIYEGDYEGLYCESCEAFYTEKDLSEGLCPQHKILPKSIKEKNYFFRLSAYADKLLDFIDQNPNFILPVIRRNEIVNVIKGGLKDISVSRSGFDWGIPLPINPKHVVYVWFDALINYLTLIGFADNEQNFSQWWPAQFHIIGKDITRFHCVIWPAMLMSAGLPLPQTVFGHGFVYLKGEKMSKSLGNVVTPMDVVGQFGPCALRYYLLRATSFGDDGNFTWDDFILRYNSDLANGLGNLVSRTAGMIHRYFNGELPTLDLQSDDQAIAFQFETVLQKIKKDLDPYQSGDVLFHRALEHVWAWISEVDRYIDVQAPWTLAKQKNHDRLLQVLVTLVTAIKGVALLLLPFIPQTAVKIGQVFGWDLSLQTMYTQVELKAGVVRIDKSVGALFPRIEVPKE